jgi:hypothetical protein
MKKQIKLGLLIGITASIPGIFLSGLLYKIMQGCVSLPCISIPILIGVAVVFLLTAGEPLSLIGKMILFLYLSAWLMLTVALTALCAIFLGDDKIFYFISTGNIVVFILGILNVGIVLPFYFRFALKKIPAKFKYSDENSLFLF